MKNLWVSALLAIVLFLFYFNPALFFQNAYEGLTLWYETMICSLFPMMIIMNLLQKSGYYQFLIQPLYYLQRNFFSLSKEGTFVLFFGFFGGFPLGIRLLTNLYKENKLSKQEAEYLLCFASPLGPVYLNSYVFEKIYPQSHKLLSIVFFYAIPLFYGMLLNKLNQRKAKINSEQSMPYISNSSNSSNTLNTPSLVSILPSAVKEALFQIAMLGGYMCFFNSLKSVFSFSFWLSASMEINQGLLSIQKHLSNSHYYALYVYALLTFQGLCCMFQALSILVETDLSRQKYMLHKIILCSIVIFLFICKYCFYIR